MRVILFSAPLLFFLTALLVGCSDSAGPSTTAPPAVVDPVEVTSVSFANDRCPIMGGKPTAELTAEYQGKTIGFCCEGCPEEWAALSDQEKAEKFAKVAAGDDVQDAGQAAQPTEATADADGGDHSEHEQ